MEDARYALLLALLMSVLLFGANKAEATTGYFYYSGPEQQEVVANEYYHTSDNYECILEGKPNPLSLGNKISQGKIRSNKYNKILESRAFGTDLRSLDSIYVAYGLYVIAERIGDRESKKRQYWLARYIPPVVRQKITDTIHAKYSTNYLRECFSKNKNTKAEKVNILDIYPLYMD